jgi:tRNA-specific adenosine deaminase 3
VIEKLINKGIFNSGEIENKLERIKIPYIQPITNQQYITSKSLWHLSNLPTSTSQIIYTHSDMEKEEINKITSHLLKRKENEGVSSLLYDPVNKLVIEVAEEDDKDSNTNPIGHSIMKLIQNYSKKLVNTNDIEEILISNKKLLGEKNVDAPYDEYLNHNMINNNQYYCENFYVFTIKEPCFMCAMALVHSRIDRIYFISENTYDGALVSKLKINNYNLNHSYLIFRLSL